MNKFFLRTVGILLSFLLFSGIAFAQETSDSDAAVELEKDILMGPGTVIIQTETDIMMTYGARARIIPVSETDWDFGLTDDLGSMKLLGGGLTQNFFKNHITETGWINNNYIRSEVQLYYTAMPKDRMWSFYAALEYDRPLENSSVDDRGGKDQNTSNFGLERLHGTFKLPMNMRLHAGYDIWGVDVIDAAGLVYGDDNPGFWVTGDYDKWSFNVGYFKLLENNFQTDVNELKDLDDSDRDLFGGYLTFAPVEGQKFQPFYMYDRLRDVPVGSLFNYITGTTGETPKTDSHHIGAYYTGKLGVIELFLEGVYQFGNADDTGLTARGMAYDDYDISAYAFSGDLAFKLDEAAGFGVKPHIGFLYTSGDDDPTDDELGGYTGVENAQRFSQYFGGENTIIGDTNLVLGSVLYGYLPELYGNGTPIATGGLQNGLGKFGNGRGDNPGLTMTSVGITLTPKRFIIFRSNVNSFWWNEDIMVNSFVNPAVTTPVEAGYTGTEWDNELTLATSKHSFIKTQFSCFFPGDTVKDVTSALTALAPTMPGAQSDKTAYRLAMEFIWMF